MFSEFLISGGIMCRILGPRYLQLFRPLLAVLIGFVVKSVCDRRSTCFYDEYKLINLSVINLQMKRYCHYKQSLVLSHANDFSITIHPKKRTITKLRFNKGFHQHSSEFSCHEFAESKIFQT